MSIQNRRKIFELVSCVLLLGLGRASWCWYIAPITAFCGYALAWQLGAHRKNKFSFYLLLFTGANLLHLSWLLSHPYGYIYFVWILASVIFAAPFALLSIAVVAQKTLPLLRTIGLAALFSLLEWSYTLLPCGYVFHSAALHLSWSYAPLQLTSYIGGIGLAFFVYWTNLLVFVWWQKRGSLIFTLCVALFPYIYGSFLLWERSEEMNFFNNFHSKIRVAICQMEEPPDVFARDMPPDELHVQEWKKILTLLSPLDSKEVDLILLPEGAIPFPAQAPLFNARKLPKEWQMASPDTPSKLSSLDICRLIAWSKQATILIGLESHTFDALSQPATYNSLYCFSPQQSKPTRYDKQLLLPLGEYVPNEWFSSWLSEYGIHASFTSGTGPTVFETKTGTISPFICYEETFSSYAISAAQRNPDLLVSASNDNWFPAIRKEHLELARLRAAEVGKPLLRSCNQGASAVINALGQTVISRGETPEQHNGYIIAEVSLYSPYSPFVTIGNWSMATLLAFLAIVTLAPVSKDSKHPFLRR